MTSTTTNAISKVAAIAASFALVAGSFAVAAPAFADTTTTTSSSTTMTASQVATLQAQIASLQAQLAAAAGTSSSSMTGSMMFTRDLTIGSKGSDVTALQTWLIGKGFSIPAGATGYFGGQTRAALAAYQAANSIMPAAGYFGPKTRAVVNGSSTTTTTTTTTTVAGCAPGAMFSSTTGQACGTTTTTGTVVTGITTVGAEGTINVEKESSNVRTTVYEGDMKDKILGVRIEAKNSDMNFSRIRVNLGTTTDTYVKQFSNIYLLDDTGATLASLPLNSSTVTRVSSSPTAYYVTLSGFSSIIKKDVKRSYYIAVDAYPSISTQYRGGTQTINLYGSDAIRATDGAGIDEYSTGAESTVTQSFNISGSLQDNATLTVSTDPSVRKATTIVADQGANNNEIDKAEIGSFRLLAEKSDVLLRDLDVTVTTLATSTAGGSLQTLYVFDGSTQVGTASGVAAPVGPSPAMLYHFTSINQTLTRDAYKTYTLKADFRSVTNGQTWKVGAVNVINAESTGTGRSITPSNLSSGAGETMTVVANGTTVSLTSPTITVLAPKDQSANTTEAHVSAQFNLGLTAIGSDVSFGAPGTSFSFALLKNGQVIGTTTASSTRTVYYPSTQPTGTTNYSANGFTLPRNASISIPVTFKEDVLGTSNVAADLPSGDYSVRLNTITYTANGQTVMNDYSTNVNYVTPTVTRP